MKQPIAVILTDTHLKEENLQVNHQIFKQSIDYAKSIGLDRVIHLGDIFNSRKSQTIELLKHGFYSILEKFREEKMLLVAIPGNHDKVNYNSYDSFLDTYRDHPAFALFIEGNHVSLRNNIQMSLLPFYEDELYNEELQKLIEINKELPGVRHILGTHIGLDGAVMNNGTQFIGRIDKSLLKNFEKVFIGHFHDEQVLDGGHIHYIGSSFQHNFGETPNKGLFVLYDDLSYEKIHLDFPKYNTFKIDVESITQKDIEDLKKEREETGDNYRIIITGNDAKVKAYNKNPFRIDGVKVEVERVKIVEEEIEDSIEVYTNDTILSFFKDYCEKKSLPYEVGVSYLKKVL